MYIDMPMDPALVERLAAGVAQAQEGHTVEADDFNPYLDGGYGDYEDTLP